MPNHFPSPWATSCPSPSAPSFGRSPPRRLRASRRDLGGPADAGAGDRQRRSRATPRSTPRRAAVDAARARTMQSNAEPPAPGERPGQPTSTIRCAPTSRSPCRACRAAPSTRTSTTPTALTVTARQLLTDFGRTDKLVDMARSGQITAQDALEETRHQLGYQTIQSFYSVILLRSSPTSPARRSSALEEALRIAQRKFAAGSATKFDVLTTQVRLANAQQSPHRHARLAREAGKRPAPAPGLGHRHRRLSLSGTLTPTAPAIAEVGRDRRRPAEPAGDEARPGRREDRPSQAGRR